MSRILYFSIAVVQRYETSPVGLLQLIGNYLRIGGYSTGIETWSLTYDGPGQGSWDYWLMKIDVATFTEPPDVNALDFLQGDLGPESYNRWAYIYVPDDFAIPAQYDVTGVAGIFRYLSGDGGIDGKTLALSLVDSAINAFTSRTLEDLKESFWGAVNRSLGSGLGTAARNVDTARDGIYSFFGNAMDAFNFGLHHQNDPGIASYYEVLSVSQMTTGHNDLVGTAQDLTTFPDPAVERRWDELIGNMRIDMSATSAAAGTADVDILLTFDPGGATGNWSGTDGMDVMFDGVGSSAITGGLGNDLIFAGRGDDTVYAREGSDYVDAGSGNDTVFVLPSVSAPGGYATGGPGIDTIYVDSASGYAVEVNLASGFVRNTVGNQSWTFRIADFENVGTGTDQVTVVGSAGSNGITGHGSMVVWAADGDDVVTGMGSFDWIDAGGGNDRVVVRGGLVLGGLGNDTVIATGLQQGRLFSTVLTSGSSIETAIPLDSNFHVNTDPNIDTSVTTTSSQLRVTGNGTQLFYMISIEAPRTVIFDIDDTTGGLDTTLWLYDLSFGAGEILAISGDELVDPGSNPSNYNSVYTKDSFIIYYFDLPGTYYLAVRGAASAGAISNNQQFTLNVSTNVPLFSDFYSAQTTLYGQDGDDTLVTGNSSFTTLLNGGSGTDTASYVNASGAVTASLVTGIGTFQTGSRPGNTLLVEIENLTGSAYADLLTGNDRNNLLDGGNGDDTLDGRSGADTLIGGNGNDIFLVDSTQDRTIELAGGGHDLVRTGLTTWTLADNVEDVIFTGSGAFTGVGNSSDNGIAGGSGNDVLAGGAGRDTLNGRPGNDRLYGDADADFLYGEDGDDIIFGGTGNDLIYGGLGNDILVGEDGDDLLYGEAGTNVLSGGNGNDMLTVTTGGNELNGGAGNDIYVVAGRTDTIVEAANGGTDELRTTSFIYDLNSASDVETLTFTDNLQHAGVGNALDNLLVAGTATDELQGRGGNDVLRGGSGSANTLLGGTGDDIYYVEASGDTVIEYANEGIDTVSTALTVFYLRDNVENLIYTGGGTFSGVGSADNNMMTAGAGADFLNGADGNDILTGGSGADLMIGGNGADQFRYAGGETGYDRIIDFVAGTDKIALNGAFFAHTATIAFIATGAPVATSVNSTFLYDVNSGILSYDADGNGAGAAVQLAQLNTGLTLGIADFIFY